jgi:hypothetical protein
MSVKFVVPRHSLGNTGINEELFCDKMNARQMSV